MRFADVRKANRSSDLTRLEYARITARRHLDIAEFSMAPKLPPLSWLRAFDVAARHLSFTLAAQDLNLTQAAISKQVKLLEHYLHEPLFHRKPRSLTLTKAGAAYLPKVRDAFERLAVGTQEVFGNRQAKILTLRAPTSFAVNWIAPRLHRFYARHPTLRIRILSSVWRDEFDKESFDLDIRYGQGVWPGQRSSRLTWESLSPICAPSILPKLQRPEDLAQTNLIHVLGYEDGWAIWLRHVGMDEFDSGQGLQFDTSLMAFEMAALGQGVALGRSSMIAKELQSGRLVQPFELAAPIREAFHLTAPEQNFNHTETEFLQNWLLEEAAADKDKDHPYA
ncbi:MAG: LysR family glycine cleavage system transcriptional activator [Pseudorhodobacter sp.]